MMIRYEINFDDIDIEEYEEFFEEVRDYLGDSVVRSSLDERYIQGEIEEFTDEYLDGLADICFKYGGIYLIINLKDSAIEISVDGEIDRNLPNQHLIPSGWLQEYDKEGYVF